MLFEQSLFLGELVWVCEREATYYHLLNIFYRFIGSSYKKERWTLSKAIAVFFWYILSY